MPAWQGRSAAEVARTLRITDVTAALSARSGRTAGGSTMTGDMAEAVAAARTAGGTGTGPNRDPQSADISQYQPIPAMTVYRQTI